MADRKIGFSRGFEFAIKGYREDGGMKTEIGMGIILAAGGLWFGHQALLLPAAHLSDAYPPFLILKVAFSSFLFLGLSMIASALFLHGEFRSSIRFHPLNFMVIAFLGFLFFLFLPSIHRSPIILFFPLLAFCGVQRKWREITTLTLVLTFLAWAFYEVSRFTPIFH